MMDRLRPYTGTALLLVLLTLAACGGSGSSADSGSNGGNGGSGDGGAGKLLGLQQSDSQFVISDGETRLLLDRNDWHARWALADGTTLVEDARDNGTRSQTNPDYAQYNDRQDGIDKAYPGLPTVSYAPYAYLSADQWHYATGASAVQLDGDTATIDVATDDGLGATLRVQFASDGSLRMHFAPAAAASAVSTAWASPSSEHYFGGGQRFSSVDLRRTALPLWISHGSGANREGSTNEIASSFFWCPCGWGLASDSDARGEIVFARINQRSDAGRVTIENNALELSWYRGTPTQMLAARTAITGRPQWTPPDWMWRPMVWQDSDTSTDSVRALVDGMQSRGIPLGAVWLDNPWDAGKGSFDFDPARFADPDALIKEVHDKGVRFMVWLSPFVSGPYFDEASARGWVVTGTRADGNDATYYPTRGIDPHLDFTNPDAAAWWEDGLRRLIRRGVDGVKVDRGEEDLSDDSVWANGLPNRLNHNAYVDHYQHAIFDAFQSERPNGDFAIFSRGGWNGSARWSAHWEADNTSLLGDLGLTQVLRGLLSMAASGFPFVGGDIGGYAGVRQDQGESAGGIPLLPPDEPTYIRWLELGALSPVMQTDVPPWWVSDNAVRVYRRYATLHDRLVPYIAAAAKQAVDAGLPIVRPLPFSCPDDAQAVATTDEYLFGPDLLVAPVTSLASETGITTRRIYLPAGRWHNFWNGNTIDGPRTFLALVPLAQLPLYVRDGANLPAGVSADQLP
ncbi:glycoside hydrolase family 31 protein [Solimonas terrae]|uniref:Glycoside hydrolase family 31 protein n=1 Tax=Solimonas terrae TaxID=1396819 RepID=A0A6M2BVV1_9GAMM|nr:glycoside hydrolase family 31 protein [Solimonas terrae]NGY06772.1 glycoside hydrolase family 31 protein [Solimonas terrae]